MSLRTDQDYLSIGANRNSAASVWCASINCLAYGVDQNIALWRPLDSDNNGVHQILKCHAEKVTALESHIQGSHVKLISGAADGTVIVHSLLGNGHEDRILCRISAHDGAINTIASLPESPFFVTGGADTLVKIWKHSEEDISLVTIIKTKPRLIPLALAVGRFPDLPVQESFFLLAAGTRNDIQVYAISNLLENASRALTCSLTGHEGWIRSLALRKSNNGGYILASTSADKYVRLWRFDQFQSRPEQNGTANGKEIASFEHTLTAKIKTVGVGESKYYITFEALLLGHEDWVYSADWQDTTESKLLTASADGTLAIWESDPTSGIWISETRLGEISGLKGATTATGSSGGFWTGKWICGPNSTAVISLGRTGSWRIWYYNDSSYFWELKLGIAGHIDSVNGLDWAPNGEYLVTTSSDQTSRLHAEWRRNGKRTWHEFSRCQIHGYNCNVVCCINAHQFVSGADEKLLRVFNEPKELAETLDRLCAIEAPHDAPLPESAAIPVLGLSNKEMGQPDDIIEAGPRRGDEDYAAASALAGVSMQGITEPPTEDLLSRHTLWPECEKLYGHGYEISEAAYANGILATACKASSIDHATIRLYDAANDWRQIDPPLTAHSLTVTRLAWSRGGAQYLLSVGRDRQWTVFTHNSNKKLQLYQALPKAHTRMILDAAWGIVAGHEFFATAGRDKVVKLWGHSSTYSPGSGVAVAEAGTNGETVAGFNFKLCATVSRPSAVTAVAITADLDGVNSVLAVGEEDGTLSVHVFNTATLRLEKSVDLEERFGPAKTVNRLAWRPNARTWVEKDGNEFQLAVAGADGSVRVLNLDIASLITQHVK